MDETRLKELLHYDPKTGVFTWKVNRRGRFARAGTRAGCSNKANKGYWIIGLDCKHYYAHRLAWLYMYGEFPPEGTEIDHIDRDPTNNKIINLRAVPRSTNAKNINLKTTCKYGHELTPNNLYVYSGRRFCKPCAQRRNREYKATKK